MKRDSIIEYLRDLDDAEIAELHNRYCDSNNYEHCIYPMREDIINELFATPYDFYKALPKFFNKEEMKYFIINNGCIVDPIDYIDYYELAEYLVEYGDAMYSFDITDCLIDAFKKYAQQVLPNLPITEINDIVDNSCADFLMDDWDDIIREEFHYES
jgi:hypothetical protein